MTPPASDAIGKVNLEGPLGYAFATGIALLALAVAFAAARYLGVANLSPILLVAVLFVAARTSMAVAIYTAIVCFLGYNFFFTRPYYTLEIARSDDLITVVLFLVVALVCSRLATQLANRVESLRLAQLRATAMLQLGQQLADASDAQAIRVTGAQALADATHAQVVMLERRADRSLHAVASVPAGINLEPADIAAASWNTGPGATPPNLKEENGYWMVPLQLATHDHGAAALLLAGDHLASAGDRRELALAMSQGIASALERARLAEALESSRVQAETERLRNALLSSVSHDLRSPLACIIGSAGTLAAYEHQLPAEERRQLVAGILHEGERLDRYIQNLLDMTRLGHGTLQLQRDWVDANEVVLAAVARLRKCFPAQAITTALLPDVVLLYVHPALIEQALFNVLENAAHFSPADEPVRVELDVSNERLSVYVTDRGPGIPAEERKRIFDMFYSVSRGDRDHHGTGLGLSICRGMIGAHGGSVEALDSDRSGTVIRISLPLPPTPESDA